MRRISVTLTILGLLVGTAFAGKPADKGGGKDKGGNSASVALQTVHFTKQMDGTTPIAIQPQSDILEVPDYNSATYVDGEPGITITLDGGTYNMTMQCPTDSMTCQRAFGVDLLAREAGCDSFQWATARVTLWVDNVPQCTGLDTSDPSCPGPVGTTARAQIRKLESGGAVGTSVTLEWASGQAVASANTDGSWDIEGFEATYTTGRGKNKTVCTYDAAFSLNARPLN